VWTVKEPFSEFVKREFEPKTLLITCGLPGTWKTETSEEVSKISDLIRLQVLKNEDIFDQQVAANMNKRLSVYDELFKQAAERAEKTENGLILDATFVTQDLRKRAAEIAANSKMLFVILQTSCPETVSVERIKRRTKEKYESNALTVEAYLNNKNKFEPVNINELKNLHPQLKIVHMIVDTCHDDPQDWRVISVERR
jgi:predicted kinase